MSKSIPDDLRQVFKDCTAESFVELREAIKKHGLQNEITLSRQHMIASEEFGEVAKALLDRDYVEARLEIRQTIAMLMKLDWLILKKHPRKAVVADEDAETKPYTL